MEMRNIFIREDEGDLMDKFSFSGKLSNAYKPRNIDGYYGLATITFDYQLSNIDNGACCPPFITHLNEGT